MSFLGKRPGPSERPIVDQLRSLSDEKLMTCLARGNYDALGVIFNRYQRVVTRVAMQVLRDASEAEELMQSVFLQRYTIVSQSDIAEAIGKLEIRDGHSHGHSEQKDEQYTEHSNN